MRKGLLIAVVAIGSAITGSAQASQGDISIKVNASQINLIDDSTTAAGNVEIVISGARLRADNATFHSGTKTIDLSGHVQLTLPTK